METSVKNSAKQLAKLYCSSGSPGRRGAVSFREGLVCRGVNHLQNDVQVINRKLQLVR